MAKKCGGKGKTMKQQVEMAGKVRVFTMDVDNPMFSADHRESRDNPMRVTVDANMNESPIMRMYARGSINPAQLRVASRIRGCYEAAGGAGVKAMDYTKELVDGGISSDGLTDRRQAAAKDLAALRDQMGTVMYDLVEAVCGRCIWLRDIEPDKTRRERVRSNLLAGLTLAARYWGYETQNRYWRKTGS